MEGDFRARFVWVLITAALSVLAIVFSDVVLGLDLQGGVTLRYELQPPDTTVGADMDSMVQDTIDTLNSRIDTYGILESSITRQGSNEIVIELPGSGKDAAETIKSVISRVGHLEWRIMASDDLKHGVKVDTERAKLTELLEREEYRGKAADDVDTGSLDLKFEDVLYRWIPYSDKIMAERRGAANLDAEVLASAPLTADDYRLVRIETAQDRSFTGADIETAYPSQDSRQGMAVGVSIRAGRSSEFGDFTEEFKGQLLGIVLDGRLAQHPATINDRLEGQFIIQSGAAGGFLQTEIKDYLTIIKSGSLRMKPHLLYENSVGPSLGETAIRAGIQAMLWGSLAVVAFIILYYRVHGVAATLCLADNVLLLTGALMFLGATLTLPGIAGLVLTMGMAVDGNILVLERVREEIDRSKSLAQATKLGFEKATSTIVDANVTTLLTALLLLKLGSGPVKGFAVVLSLGILTSVFSVLVFGRALYQWTVAKGWITSTHMARWVRADSQIRFMATSRKCLVVSTVAVVASLVGFAIADRDIYGLDFLGGYKAQLRLSRPATQGEVLATVGSRFPGAQVVSVTEPGQPPDQAREFVVKIKSTGAESAQGTSVGATTDLVTEYEQPLRDAMGSLLLPPFVADLQMHEDQTSQQTAISCVLHFEQEADPARVAAHLNFLSNLECTAASGGGVALKGSLARLGMDRAVLQQRLRTSLAAAPDVPPVSLPFVESTTISGRVSAELGNSAARALLLSFVAIIIYIRLRFREYSYGISAVLALIHDVSIAAGAVVLAHKLGWVNVEIDLTTIAAFLTIVGFSVNDTIVLYDRIRENLPRLNMPLDDVIDVSMNQILARSILTSTTVLLPLLVIFVLNWGKDNVLEGFAFTMGVGVLVGCYSTIFIACPLLVLMHERRRETPR